MPTTGTGGEEPTTHVFGPLYVKTTAYNKVKQELPTLPEVPGFTDISCETVLKLLTDAVKAAQMALQLPKKLLRQLQKLLNYPFDTAAALANQALGIIDLINNEINSATSDIRKLKSALEKLLDCPIIADSELGRQIAAILDTDADPTAVLNAIKAMLLQEVNETIEQLKKTPQAAINNLSNMYNEAVKASGIEEMLKQIKILEQCVRDACAAYQASAAFIKKLPTSSDELVASIKGTFGPDGKLVTGLSNIATATQQQALKVAQDVKDVLTVVQVNP